MVAGGVMSLMGGGGGGLLGRGAGVLKNVAGGASGASLAGRATGAFSGAGAGVGLAIAGLAIAGENRNNYLAQKQLKDEARSSAVKSYYAGSGIDSKFV